LLKKRFREDQVAQTPVDNSPKEVSGSVKEETSASKPNQSET